MDFPWICQCGHENLIDLERLEQRQESPVVFSLGFDCRNCHARQVVIYTTRSLDEAFSRLETTPIDHPKFQFLFAKTLRKAEGVNQRGAYG